MFLNCIISKMHERVLVFIRVLVRSSSDVTLLVEIASYCPIGRVYHNIVPDIEFTTLVQEGLSDVLLDYVGEGFAICMGFSVSEDFLYLVYIITDFDAAATVRHLSWL